MFEICLSEIKKLCTPASHVILSIPVFGLAGYIKIWAPKYINWTWIIGIRYYKPGVHVMCPSQHYWEINSKKYKLKMIKSVIGKEYEILNLYRVKEVPYHMFFILKP